MRVAYAFRPFPANYKPSCDATIPAKPSWSYPLKTSLSIPLTTVQQPRSTTIYVNNVPYTVIRLLGEGLHSRVYAAYNRRTSEPVAIKVVQNVDLIRRNEHSKMFFKEIRYLTKLQTRNPYVIRVHDYEFDPKAKTGKIVMETGKDFRFMLPLQATPKEKKMSVETAKFYWYQMLEAVASLHRHGFVHSDIKPENFIITDGGQLRVIDLGLSFRLAQDETSVLRPFAGTPEYMPPEVCRIENGRYSRQGQTSDIWALGVLLFEMIFGYRPFEHIRDNYDKMSHIARLTQDPSIPSTSDPDLIDILELCLQINPDDRPSAEELLQHAFFDF